MKDLFSRLTDILGKQLHDSAVVNFLDALGGSPDIEYREGGECWYYFPAYGFSFNYDPLIGYIWLAYIYCRTPEAWKELHRGCKAFVGSLPASVSCCDDRASVQSKLRSLPIETYMERAPTRSPEFSEEQTQAFMKWMRGDEDDLPELASPVQDWMEKWENMPDEIVVDVYSAGSREWHFFFLIEDQRLLEIRLYLKSR